MTNLTPTSNSLSEREVEVVHYLSYGLTNAEIADMLYLSRHTVKAHLQRIAAKMGVGDRAGIVGLAFRSGILAVSVDEQPVSEYGHTP
jgi:DNA-binding CsgD family transcriptional regulator